MSRHSKVMNQRCSESNELPKDEDSKLKKEEEKREKSADSRNIYHQLSPRSIMCFMF
jgi:hypothetical protein